MPTSNFTDQNHNNVSKEESFFTPAQIVQIVKVLRVNYTHLLWFKLLYTFGMNLRDLIQLRVGDIDFENSKINLRGTERVLYRTSDIPFSILCDLRIFCNQKNAHELVFVGRHGKLHTRTVQKAFEKIEIKLGLKFTIPKLRRSIAVHLQQNGWSQKDIGDFLGHLNHRSTKNLFNQINNRPKGDLVSIEHLLK